MGLKDLVIITLIIALALASRLLPGPREWWRSFSRKPLFSFLILVAAMSVFLGQPRAVQTIASEPVDAIRLARIMALVLLAVVSIAGIFSSIGRGVSSGKGIKWMIAYALFAMLSYLYSSFPLLSLWKGFEVLSVSLAGMAVGMKLKAEGDIQDAINIIILGLWFLVVSSLVGAIFSPSEAFAPMKAKGPMAFSLEGVYPLVNANTLSQVSGMVSIITLVWMVKPGNRYGVAGPGFVLLVSLACLVLSHSRTSIVALIIAAFLVLVVFRRRTLMIGAFCIGGLLLVTDVVVEYLLPYFVRGQSVQTFTSLSGRTEFWPEVIKKVGEAPFLGHGFYASQRMMWNISSVDNTYLEVMLGLGVMGLIVFCVPVYTIVYNLWKSRPWRAGFDLASDSRFLWVQLLALFFFLFFRSLTGPSFQNLHVNLAIFVLVLVSTHRLRKMAMLREKQDKRVQDSDK
jgi:hypothetical protein